MQAERIAEASDAPAMSLRNGKDFRGPGRECAQKKRVRIGEGQNDADRIAAKTLAGGLEQFCWIFTDPELCAVHRESDDASSV